MNKNTEQTDLITTNIVIENVRHQLFSIISNSELPSSIQELIAKDFYIQVRDVSIQIYEMEKAKYEESLKESTTK
ncbi:hypothetical protein C823_007680 [Eubacterium plexicaudatum ASF492]|uniref:Uncharacterized protein n=1 Tax=Eubacterium plexicaudatum ASF492 TaxID=1235802 RepID=N2AAK2_9FIRM|nr:hypothetical protein C823_007680 [Eubacterium plexicaudatum ASF492]